MKRLKTLWALLLLCPLLSAAVVREVGPGKTHATINNALIFAQAGDEIVIYPSTYTEGALNVSSTDHNLVIRGTDTNTVILLGTRLDVGATNVLISNLQFKDWGVNGDRAINQENVNFLRVSNCFFHYTTNFAFGGAQTQDVRAVRMRNSTGHVILSNTIVGTPNVSLGRIKGIDIAGNQGSGTNFVAGTQVLGNLVKDCGGDGVNVHGTGILLQGNRILDCVDSFGVTNHSDGIQLVKATLDGQVNCDSVVIDQNVIRNATQGLYVEGFVPGGGGQMRNVWVTRNVLYNTQTTVNGYNMAAAGAKLCGIIGTSNIWVYNNTFGDHSNNAILVQDSVNQTVHIAGNLFVNVVANAALHAVYFEAGTNDIGTLNFNGYWHPGGAAIVKIATTSYTTMAALQAAGWDLQGTNANPLIAAFPDPIPATNAPTVNVSTNFAGVFWTTGRNGVAAPQGSGWDMGAYEVAGAGGGGPPPAPAQDDDFWSRIIHFFFPIIIPFDFSR